MKKGFRKKYLTEETAPATSLECAKAIAVGLYVTKKGISTRAIKTQNEYRQELD
jgi:hypothetical protein